MTANPTRSITPNISATLIDDVDTPLPEEEVDEGGNVDDEAPLEVVVDHVMSRKKYVREGYIMGLNCSLICRFEPSRPPTRLSEKSVIIVSKYNPENCIAAARWIASSGLDA